MNILIVFYKLKQKKSPAFRSIHQDKLKQETFSRNHRLTEF
jgi:hypothetical protein